MDSPAKPGRITAEDGLPSAEDGNTVLAADWLEPQLKAHVGLPCPYCGRHMLARHIRPDPFVAYDIDRPSAFCGLRSCEEREAMRRGGPFKPGTKWGERHTMRKTLRRAGEPTGGRTLQAVRMPGGGFGFVG